MRFSPPFRTLFAVYAVAALVGIGEYIITPALQISIKTESPGKKMSAAVSRLYPKTAQAELLLGRQYESQAGQGFNRDELQRDPELVKKYISSVNEDLLHAKEHYERAIAMGLKSDESLYYNYALTLIRLREDPERIDRAIAEWRHNFPFSSFPDLNERRKSVDNR